MRPRSAISEVALPTLLPEIWLNVIAFLPIKTLAERCYLWSDFRRVSRLFNAAIESHFAKHILQHYELKYDLGTWYCGVRCDLTGTTFKFASLSEDGQRAVFKREGWERCEDDWLAKSYRENIVSRMSRKLSSADFVNPPHYVSYRGGNDMPDLKWSRRAKKFYYMQRHRDTSDTELLELEFDETNGELSFHWQGFLSYWYAE